MAWSTPPTYTAGQLMDAADMNLIGNDLIYLKQQADFLFSISGQGSGTVTILPVGAVTRSVMLFGSAWNETSGAVISSTTAIAIKAPGAAVSTLSDGGPANTITISFNADGSVTAARTLGSATWGLRLLVIYA